MSAPSLRILVCCHKPTELVEDAVYLPIHCGRAVMGQEQNDGTLTDTEQHWMLEHTIGDDTGENISARNNAYSELTAHYWARHNYDALGNPDYIGFIHYRRGFLLAGEPTGGEVSVFPTLTPRLRAMMQDASQLQLGKYELYAPEDVQAVRYKVSGGHYTWTQYPPVPCKVIEKNPGNVGLDTALEYIRQRDPHRFGELNRSLNGTRAFQWNMFIMSRAMFFEYADYLFDVLRYTEENVDSSGFTGANRRFLGYVGEHLTGGFIDEMRRRVATKLLPSYAILRTDSGTADAFQKLLANPGAVHRRLLFLRLKHFLSRGLRRLHYHRKITALEDELAFAARVENHSVSSPHAAASPWGQRHRLQYHA